MGGDRRSVTDRVHRTAVWPGLDSEIEPHALFVVAAVDSGRGVDPPYSPELNPIEGVWKTTQKTTTHNRFYELVLDATHDALTVARLRVVASGGGESGSDDFIAPRWRRLALLSLAVRRPGEAPGIPDEVAGPHAGVPGESAYPDRSRPAHDPCRAWPITSVDLANDGRIVFVQDERAALLDHSVATFTTRDQIHDDPPRVASSGRLVVHDTQPQGHLFAVRDPGAAPRRVPTCGE